MDENMRALMARLEELVRNVHQYVGARYVPNFIDDPWNDTTRYEALDVVDNGSGTSYIAKKPVPVGTPLSDREYWFVYGSTNGAIINLQNQIDSILSSIAGLTNGYVFPEDYGAVGDGVTNDYDALNDAFTEAVTNDKTLVISKKYNIGTSSIVSDAINIMSDGIIIYDGSGIAITLGSATPGLLKNIKIKVESSNPTTPVSGSTGLVLKNLSGCTVEVYTNGFTTGVVCEGSDSKGWQNNTMLIDYIYNSDVGLVLRPHDGGWVNSNTFIGGKIGYSSLFTPTNGVGISINDLSGSFCNNNIFINQNLEGCLVGVKLNKCYANEFLYGRFEGVTTNFVYTDAATSIQNIIEPCYATMEGELNVIDLFSKSVSSFKNTLDVPLCGGVYNNNYFSCKGITGAYNGNLIPMAEKITCNSKKIQIVPTKAIGARLNVTSKYLLIDCDTLEEWRAFIIPYNGDTPITGHMQIVYDTHQHGYTADSVTLSLFGLSFERTAQANFRKVIILPNNCDNVFVMIASKDNTSTLEISNIHFESPSGLGLITLGNDNYPILAGAPTSAPSQGTFAMNYTPDSTNKGWIYDGSAWINS